VNAREMRALIDLARGKGLFMMEGMWTRFLPAMVQLRKWLAEGAIGEIKQVRATFGFQFPFDRKHRLFNPDLAGGALLDAGIYPLSFANMVMREAPREVSAIGQIGATGVDEQTVCIFSYSSGAIGIIDSTVSAPVISRAEVIGTQGRICIPDRFLATQMVRLEPNGEDPIERVFPHDDRTAFRFEIEAASECIRAGQMESETMPLDDSLQLMETIDRIKAQLGLVYANDRTA
jgi:predicted dehydrogenase